MKSALLKDLKNSKLSPSRPISPGEVIRDQFLFELKITRTHLAQSLKIPIRRLNFVINGKKGITANLAIRLSKVLGPSPKFWLGTTRCRSPMMLL